MTGRLLAQLIVYGLIPGGMLMFGWHEIKRWRDRKMWKRVMASEEEGVYCDVCAIHYDKDDPCPFH